MQGVGVHWSVLAAHVLASLLAMNLADEASGETRHACGQRHCCRGRVARALRNAVVRRHPKPVPFRPQCADARATANPTLSGKSNAAALRPAGYAELPYGDGLTPMINAVVQLTSQVTAFGTDHGLSLWNGKTFELLTGPYYEPTIKHGTTVQGNSELPANQIQDLLLTDDDKLWIATSKGLAWYQNGTIVNVTRMLPATGDKSEEVWEQHGNQGQLVRGPDFGHDVWCLFRRSNGQMVVGTRNAGVILYDPAHDFFRLVYRQPDMNQWVSAMAEDREGTLWIAIRGLGVLRYTGDKITQLRFPKDWGPDEDVAHALSRAGRGVMDWDDSWSGGLPAKWAISRIRQRRSTAWGRCPQDVGRSGRQHLGVRISRNRGLSARRVGLSGIQSRPGLSYKRAGQR